MKNTYITNLVLSLVTFLLIVFSTYKDTTTIFTLILGSVTSILGSSVYVFSLIEPWQRMQLRENVQKILPYVPFVGVLLQITGMFFAKFLATFYIYWLPFGFYMVLSFIIIVQLHLSIKILRNELSTTSEKHDPITE